MSAGHFLKAVAIPPSHPTNSLLDNFRKSIGARHYHFLAVEKGLSDTGTAALQSHVALGYKPVGVSPFWLAGSQTALLPLQLSHQTEGILDTQVLVFSRSSTGEWHPTGSLSGFHLEAIAEALPELQAYQLDAEQLRKLILPHHGKGKFFANGSAHPTESGHFGLSVQISAGITHVEATIAQAGKTIWQKAFSSHHALRYAPGLLA